MTSLSFDDLYEEWTDRFIIQQTPIHSLSIFAKADVKATIKGSFLGRC